MKVLVINAGSSSLKYQLIDMENEEMICKGNCERIGQDVGVFSYKTADGQSVKYEVAMKDHTAAFTQVKNALLNEEYGVLKDLGEVTAIGHRVVQGGALFNKSVLVDDQVIEGIKSLIPLAPLHNAAHVQGIEACRAVFGEDVPEVVVFDTAFHSTMPPEAYMYAIPYEYYEKYSVRRYGFHGTSHRYVSHRCAEMMGKNIEDLKIITCHLGNGSSLAAVKNGKVVDTSMGLTPLGGFMMGTRSGDLDPSVITFIAEKEGVTAQEMSELLNKKSGLYGICGFSDDRDVSAAEEQGDEKAALAHKMLAYEVKKFIGSYMAAMDGCDAIVFTAGLGENQPQLRRRICANLDSFGIKVDEAVNEEYIHGKGGVDGAGLISAEESKIPVFVIPTNEELVIARDTRDIVLGMTK